MTKITLKSEQDLVYLAQGGKILANILQELTKLTKSGVKGSFLDQKAAEMAEKAGASCSFFNYEGYSAHLCLSTNDEVVHGLPFDKIIREDDLVSLDLGIKYKNLFTDSAVTFLVSKNKLATKNLVKNKLINTTFACLKRSLKYCQTGYRLGDIGFAIQSLAEKEGFSVVKKLVGHGVGYAVHEDPYVPNYGQKNTGLRLKPGMVIAIEPMLNQGTDDVLLDKNNNWSYRTADQKLSAHFEWTVTITRNKPIVLTPLNWIKKDKIFIKKKIRL